MELFVGDGGALGVVGSLLDATTPSSSLEIVELHSEATVRLDSGRSEIKSYLLDNWQNFIHKLCQLRG